MRWLNLASQLPGLAKDLWWRPRIMMSQPRSFHPLWSGYRRKRPTASAVRRAAATREKNMVE